MDEELIKEILAELVSIDEEHSEGEVEEKEYIKAKAELFNKYIDNREELSEALVKSPYCFITYFKSYFKKRNKKIEFMRGCIEKEIGCDKCCREYMYDSIIKHINRIKIE